jgi:hypothetical protein
MTNRRPTVTVRAATARGYRITDFCEREGISRSTCWEWARKGVVVVSRLRPAVGVRAVGVRVVYADSAFDRDGE